MFASGKTAAVAGAGPDDKFNYVTMLLHGDGTNGAQNNTFLDSSTNNFTITRNGNTTQGSFSPYGSNWSNYFDGSTSYLSVPSSSALAFGTGDFTVELWVNYYSDTGNYVLYDGRGTSILTQIGFVIYLAGGILYAQQGVTPIVTTTSPTANTWHHIAFSRSGSSNKFFVDGTQVGTTVTDSTNYSTAYSVGIGTTLDSSYTSSYDLNGYLSNVRVVKGSAVYTSNFTPSTTPLTAITNTSLLTCQSNRFVDNSSNAFTITPTGTPSVQRFNPFGASTAYSTSVIGGSGYFDGSGDTLTTSTSQIIPTGSFTVECWAYVTGTGANQKFVAQGSSGAAGRFSLGIEGGNWWVQLGGDAIQTGTPVKNQWNYVAVTYNGSTITLYVNGTSIGTVSSTANAQNTTLTIGQDWNSYIVTGYVADVRISNTVRTITSPTAPYSSDGSTRLLLSMTNGAIFDNAMMNDLETVGNAQISTSVVKYGTGSLAFDGTGDALIGQNTPNISLSGDFTIEAWVYQTSAGQNAPQICFGDAANSGTFILYISTSQQLAYYINGATTGSGGTAAINTWHHIAMVRSGSTITTYLNGVSQNTVTASTTFSGVPYFGAALFSGTIYYGAGYMDDLRITKGYARYTANFTPPTAAFPNTGPN